MISDVKTSVNDDELIEFKLFFKSKKLTIASFANVSSIYISPQFFYNYRHNCQSTAIF